MKEKKEIRKTILQRRKALDQETVRRLSRVICEKVSELKAYKAAEDICLYMPINNEVDVTLLIRPAIAAGKRVWLPKVKERSASGEGEMDFFRYDETTPLTEGVYHIREPQSEQKLVPDERTLILMPGAVFSENRDRIGYGGGYYDRYLSQHPGCKTAAACYDFQILPKIPAEPHDVRLRIIVSPRRIITE